MRPEKYVVSPVDSLAIVDRKLLQPAGLDLSQLDRALGALMTRQLDYGDFYFQFTRFETWTIEDGIVKDGTHSVEQGVGVRAVAGEKTGFAYSDQLDAPALKDAVEAARGIVRTRGDGRAKTPRATQAQQLYPADDPSLSLDDAEKVELLLRLDRETRAMDERVIQVIGSLASVYEMILVQGSDGVLGADIRPLVRLNVSVITQKGDRREQGYAGCGGRGDLSLLTATDQVRSLAAEAVRQASVNMDAIPAPAGVMPVVLGPGWPGILLHEAIGHGLEGDFNRKGTSAFSGLIGERVASPECSVVDDGTLEGRRGSLNIDDTVQYLDRERGTQGIFARQAECETHEYQVDGKRASRIVRVPAYATNDQYLYVAGQACTGGCDRVGR